jgi:putative transposase
VDGPATPRSLSLGGGETAPRYLLRDRDGIFGPMFVNQVRAMGMSEVLSTPGSPWQRAYIERVIGTIRRECLDHVIVCSERGLRHHLRRFVDYYNDVSYCPTSLGA